MICLITFSHIITYLFSWHSKFPFYSIPERTDFRNYIFYGICYDGMFNILDCVLILHRITAPILV